MRVSVKTGLPLTRVPRFLFSLSKALEEIRRDVGGATWASLYQQRPAAAEGAIFKREWFRYFREQPVLKRVVMSWDTAFKTGAENDFSACTIWGVAENGYYLLWFWRDKVEFPELKRRMMWLASEYKPDPSAQPAVHTSRSTT